MNHVLYYGVPYTDKLDAYNNSGEARDNEEPTDLGFVILCRTVGSPRGYLGVRLLEEKTKGYVPLGVITGKGDPFGINRSKSKVKAGELFEDLSPKVKSLLAEDGILEPGHYLTWV